MSTIRYGARSLDELRNRELEATRVDTWATTLVATFETDPDAIAAVLPPPLAPPAEPLVRLTIATVDVGRGYPVFGAGTFAVHARHDDVEGDYALVMPMTTEQAVIGGRETFGEPKKLADIRLERDGDGVGATVHAAFTRMGVTFVEVTGRVAEQLDPTPDRTRTSFYFKFLPSPRARDSTGSRCWCIAGARKRPARCGAWTARSPCVNRASIRSWTCRCAGCARSNWPSGPARRPAR